jgi:putative salt-induced outer membrane protein
MRSPSIPTLAAVLLSGAVVTPCFAQQPPAEEPPPRLEAAAQFALLAATGNSDAKSLGLSGELAWRPAAWTFISKAIFAQNEADDVLSARSFLGAFRAARSLTERLSVFGEYGYLRDIFAGIEHRNTIAGGLGYKLVMLPAHELIAAAGVGFEAEDRIEFESNNVAIATGGVQYRWKISETSGLVEELRYVQSLSEGSDWKLDQTVALTAAITSVISVKFSNIVRFVNEPVPTFDSTDTITAAAIVWTITRP